MLSSRMLLIGRWWALDISNSKCAARGLNFRQTRRDGTTFLFRIAYVAESYRLVKNGGRGQVAIPKAAASGVDQLVTTELGVTHSASGNCGSRNRRRGPSASGLTVRRPRLRMGKQTTFATFQELRTESQWN